MPNQKSSKHRCLRQQALKLDRFGYEVEMHYQGSSTYRTLIGAIVTVCSYSLILINSLSIFGDFISNGNQTEISRKINVNVDDLGERVLQDSMIGISWLNFLNQSVGRLQVSQVFVDFTTPSGYRFEEIQVENECKEFKASLNQRYDQYFLS